MMVYLLPFMYCIVTKQTSCTFSKFQFYKYVNIPGSFLPNDLAFYASPVIDIFLFAVKFYV